MTTVERRTFQRNPAEWLNRAEAGEEIVIQSRGHTPLTIKAGKPVRPVKRPGSDWDEHFRWLYGQQPVSEAEFRELVRRDR
jgi:antitoxin (DNA-binding transcriptional repressor) of toxin-antitoxin stability system